MSQCINPNNTISYCGGRELHAPVPCRRANRALPTNICECPDAYTSADLRAHAKWEFYTTIYEMTRIFATR